MNTRLSILFYAKKAKAVSAGLLPIYLRVTINGQRFETSTKRLVEPDQWSVKAGRIKPNIKTEEAKTLNAFLDSLKAQVYEYQRQIVQERLEFNLDNFKNKWLGISDRPRLICEIFQHHNDQFKQLALTGTRSLATWERWETALMHLRNFIFWKFKIKDIDVKKINYQFATDFDFYLKTFRRQQHNTSIKYIEQLKSVITLCLKNDWLAKDPFIGFKITKKEVKRQYLSEEEIQLLHNKEFATFRINQVRDVFLFSCYTGLAYIDVKQLTPNHISIGIDGEKWIFTQRQKTESLTHIPLLPPALEILERYKNDLQCINKGILLPVFSNQKMNTYLKEIADVCGIEKNMTFHMARHTFATTITLSNNVPIESVSKMLGHRSIKQTQHYAKILDKRVSYDMQQLKSRFSKKTDLGNKETG
jgi:integrase